MKQINAYFQSQQYCLLSLIELNSTYIELIQFLHTINEDRISEKQMNSLISITELHRKFDLKP